MAQHAEKILERLLAIDWEDYTGEFTHAASRACLMAEYLRRSALWAERLDAGDEWPFFDIAAHIVPGIHTDPSLLTRLEQISNYLSRPPVRISVEGMLRWATVLDTPNIHAPDLPDPYEPLLIMFERGGGAFVAAKGFINLTARVLPIKNWRERRNAPPLESLDSKTLDELDKTG